MNISFLKKLFCRKEDAPVSDGQIANNTVNNEEYDVEEMEYPEIEEDKEEESPTYTSKPIYYGSKYVILLDNGHAKSTAGKRSPKLSDGSQFFEYEFNRDVVNRIAKKLDVLGIKYHILVPELEQDIPLTTRANRANEYCKKYGTNNCLFISVHSNAYGNGKTWTDAGKWSVWTTVGVTKSDAVAKTFYETAEEMLKPYGFACRNGAVQGNGNSGPDYESNFTVLYKTWCPAVLTENLFYTNKKECEWLMTNEGRQVIADIHVEAIKRIIAKQ